MGFQKKQKKREPRADPASILFGAISGSILFAGACTDLYFGFDVTINETNLVLFFENK